MAKPMRWDDLPDVMTVGDLSGVLKTSPRNVREMLRNGKIRAVKCGNKWLVAKENVMAYVRGE